MTREFAQPTCMVEKVARLELWHVAVPLPKPFHPSWIPGYPQTENRFTLLRATTNEGKVGLAAGAAFSTEREGLGAVLGPYLMGLTFDRAGLTAMSQRLNELAYLGWRNHWIEAAFYDLFAQTFQGGHPLWRFFGGQDPELACYASTGERRSPEGAAKLVKELARRGFPAVKIRVHAPTLEEDLAVLRAAAEAAKEAQVGLAVDANQGWPVSVIEPTVPWGYDRALKFARTKWFRLSATKIGSSDVPVEALRNAVKKYVTASPLAARLPFAPVIEVLATGPGDEWALREQARRLGRHSSAFVPPGDARAILAAMVDVLAREGVLDPPKPSRGNLRATVAASLAHIPVGRLGAVVTGLAEGAAAAKGVRVALDYVTEARTITWKLP